MKIVKYLTKFLKAKKKILAPKKREILIFDKMGSKDCRKYFRKYSYDVLDVRGESINLFILLKSLLKLKLNFRAYIETYIETVKPNILLTFIDSNQYFYSLSRKYSKIKTVVLQRGVKSHFNDLFAFYKSFNIRDKADLIFVANDFYKKKFTTLSKGKVVTAGYFKNNLYPISNKKKKREILLISTFRTHPKDQIVYKNLPYKEYIKNDSIFYEWLNSFCNNKKIKINILARTHSEKEFEKEKNYFKNFFYNAKIIYENKNPYKWIDKYEYIITNDSTLGIENIARGGKSAFICNSPNIYPFKTRKFGYNENLPENGPFWTYKNNTKKFEKILKYLLHKDRKYWGKIKNKVIKFDSDNKIFQNEISKILNHEKL